MKKYLPFLSIAFLVAACNSKPVETETRTIQSTQTTTVDTAGLSQFQQWKAQNELAVANEAQSTPPPAASAPVKTVTIVREVRVPEKAPVRHPVTALPAPVVSTPPVTASNTPAADAGNSGTVSSTSESSNTANAPATQPAETAKKKGWSSSAKGAAIGGAGGAVLGAILNKKNPGAGAVIGGVLGAGVGYGIGKHKDNKGLQQQ